MPESEALSHGDIVTNTTATDAGGFFHRGCHAAAQEGLS